MIQERAYLRDQVIVKIYGTGKNRKIKVIQMGMLRNKGVEMQPEFVREELRLQYEDSLRDSKEEKAFADWMQLIDDDFVPGYEAADSLRDACWILNENAYEREMAAGTVPKSDETAEKMREAKIRARSVIFEYAFCNPWDWFFTGTLDPEKYDRTDLDKFHKDLTRFLRNVTRYYAGVDKIDFLLIPELHADGKSWHIHGLLRGLPADALEQFRIGDKMGAKLAQKVSRGDVVYNWVQYQKKFGFCDLEPIKDEEAVAKYCTKYITKSLQHSVTELGAHLYYHSRGLNRAQVAVQGNNCGVRLSPDYKNDYCSVVWLPYSDELLVQLKEGIS